MSITSSYRKRGFQSSKWIRGTRSSSQSELWLSDVDHLRCLRWLQLICRDFEHGVMFIDLSWTFNTPTPQTPFFKVDCRTNEFWGQTTNHSTYGKCKQRMTCKGTWRLPMPRKSLHSIDETRIGQGQIASAKQNFKRREPGSRNLRRRYTRRFVFYLGLVTMIG